jgi:hypothetical protein
MPAGAQWRRRQQDPNDPAIRLHAKMIHDQKKALNKERQADLRKDMDKLYALATDLKKMVDKTDENILSLDVIKKTEEIEKLSKDIRTKMKDAY